MEADRNYQRAWWSLVLFLPCFVGAFLVGEGLISLLGYDSVTGESPPFWAILVAGVPALVLFAVPGLLALFFARRSARPDAMVPAWIGLGVAGAFIALNVLSYVVGLIAG